MDIKSLKKFIEKHWVVITLSVIVIFGFILRIFHLGDQSYWIDEGFTLNAVLETLEKGYPILDSGKPYSRELLNTYLIAGSVKLFGFNPWAARIVSVLFGTGFIALIYFFVKKLFQNKKLALLSSFLVSVSYWEIAWSRQSRMYVVLQFFFFLSLYLFWGLLEKFSWRRSFLFIATTMCAIYSHHFGWFLLVIYLLMLFVKYFNPNQLRKFKFALKNKKFVWAVFLFLVILVPFLAYKFYSIYLGRFDSVTVSGDNRLTAGLYVINIMKIYGHIIILALISLSLEIYQRGKKDLLQIIFLFAIYVIPFSFIIFSTDLVHLRYMFFIYPVLLVLISMLTLNVIRFLFVFIKGRSAKKITVLIVLALLLFGLGGQLVVWPQVHYELERRTPQPDFKGAYEAIRVIGLTEDDKIISSFPHMDRVYLDQTSFWLAISLSGKSVDLEKNIISGRNSYTNTPILKDLNHLDDIKNESGGYIILDSLAMNRLGDVVVDKIKENTKLIWSSFDGYNSIIVLRF